eukprot:m.712849 g.712849  ORF g.712849 m.712849 type:complete len:68 (+) comp58779_c0_seq13:409-612(+)
MCVPRDCRRRPGFGKLQAGIPSLDDGLNEPDDIAQACQLLLMEINLHKAASTTELDYRSLLFESFGY